MSRDLVREVKVNFLGIPSAKTKVTKQLEFVSDCFYVEVKPFRSANWRPLTNQQGIIYFNHHSYAMNRVLRVIGTPSWYRIVNAKNQQVINVIPPREEF
jgi:hypothetical protein